MNIGSTNSTHCNGSTGLYERGVNRSPLLSRYYRYSAWLMVKIVVAEWSNQYKLCRPLQDYLLLHFHPTGTPVYKIKCSHVISCEKMASYCSVQSGRTHEHGYL